MGAARLIFSLILTISPLVGWAQDASTDVAKVGQTPFARNPHTQYYSLPISADLNFNNNRTHHTQQVFSFKPIISFQTHTDYDLILRTIAPFLYHQPKNSHSHNYITGYGDLNPTLFISPSKYREILWGIGPTVSIPTASSPLLGTGKWSAGPEFSLCSMHANWVIGILTSNIWSFAGDLHRENVNLFSFEYFISYNFSNGWYLTSQPTITADWKAKNSERWTVPFSFGGGKGFHINEDGITVTLQAYYNAITPSTTGRWTLEAVLEFDIKDRDTKR